MSSQADSSVHNPDGTPISTTTLPVSTTSMTIPTMSSQADSLLHNPDGTPISPVSTTSTTMFPVSTTSMTIPTTIASTLTMAPLTPSSGDPPLISQQSPLNLHSPFPLQFPTNYPFSTSIPPLWTPPQPATTRALFSQNFREVGLGIDQVTAGIHGLHLSGGFNDPLIGNSGFRSLNPPHTSHISSFPSPLTAPNVLLPSLLRCPHNTIPSSPLSHSLLLNNPLPNNKLLLLVARPLRTPHPTLLLPYRLRCLHNPTPSSPLSHNILLNNPLLNSPPPLLVQSRVPLLIPTWL